MKQRFSGSRRQALQDSDPWEKGNSKVSSVVGQPASGGTSQAAGHGGRTQIKLAMPVAWRDRVQHPGSPRWLELFGQSCRGKRQSSGALQCVPSSSQHIQKCPEAGKDPGTGKVEQCSEFTRARRRFPMATGHWVQRSESHCLVLRANWLRLRGFLSPPNET